MGRGEESVVLWWLDSMVRGRGTGGAGYDGGRGHCYLAGRTG
jgi:hypothetical protein